MKFTLIFDDDLPSSGNKPKPRQVAEIRNIFHDQLDELWERHVILRELARTARVPQELDYGVVQQDYSSFKLSQYNDPIPHLKPGHLDLCAPIQKALR